jgi:hypothetical protein
MVSKLFHILSSLLPASVLMLALFSDVSSAHTLLLRSSSAFHSWSAPSSVHRIQRTFASLEAEDLIGSQGEPISIIIKLPSPSEDGGRVAGTTRFLMFRGLPELFVLSAGFRTKSAWMVSAADLPNLQLHPAPDFRGAILIEVTAHSADGRIVARTTVPVIITPANDKVSHAASLVETGREHIRSAHANLASTASDHSDQQMRAAFEVFLKQYSAHRSSGVPNRRERDALYGEFVRWRLKSHGRDAE